MPQQIFLPCAPTVSDRTFRSHFSSLALHMPQLSISPLLQKLTDKLKNLLNILQLLTNPVLSYIVTWGVREAAVVEEEPLLRVNGEEAEAQAAGAVEDVIPVECVNPDNHEVVRRKALLIGVEDSRDPGKTQKKGKKNKLRGPHHDVDVMRKILIKEYGYNPQDIVVLVDDDNDANLQPTCQEIIHQIQTLVQDARSGDRFFFHFSGHAGQEVTDDPSEDDGKNEFIITSDGHSIMDDDLKKILVDPLPVGSRLTAVMDCCHSCTLLDLPHYRCNRIYVPWFSKGFRKTGSKYEAVQRKGAFIHDANVTSNGSQQNSGTVALVRTAIRNSMSTLSRPSHVSAIHGSRELPMTLNIDIPPHVPEAVADAILGLPQVDSPIKDICDGFCRPSRGQPSTYILKTALVVCLSASKDDQLAWEDNKGASLTHYLVKTLAKNPYPTLARLLRNVSHDIHDYYVTQLHPRASESRQNQNGKQLPFKPEKHNFQDPQLSSHIPLDMSAIFDP